MIDRILNGKYRLLRLLGEGGMGAVYEARHLETDHRVAIKILHSEHTHDGARLRRFQREARAAGAIDSPHIARLLDMDTDAATGEPFMVMERLEGEDLQELLNRVGTLPPELVLRIGAQVCQGLQRAHEARVVHRDIKPANLFLARQAGGEIVIKILDFGIAKIKAEHPEDAVTTGLTRSGGMLGSPLFMSPEQARGRKSVDFRSDIWSLAIVLYRALSGHAPHDEMEALGDLILAICIDAPRPIEERAPWVSREISAILQSALRLDPDQRYASVAAMLEALRAVLPDGFAIHLDDLVPLDAASRTRPAPISGTETTAASFGNTSPLALDPGAVVTTDLERPALLEAPTPTPAPARTRTLKPTPTAAPISAPPPPPAPPPGRVGTRMAAALIAALTAFGVYTLTGPRATRALIEPVAAPRDEPRSARLVIAPSDAAAQIDGSPARARDGILILAGEIGSQHQVRLSRGDQVVETLVLLTADGPRPPAIELLPPGARASNTPAPPASSLLIREHLE